MVLSRWIHFSDSISSACGKWAHSVEEKECAAQTGKHNKRQFGRVELVESQKHGRFECTPNAWNLRSFWHCFVVIVVGWSATNIRRRSQPFFPTIYSTFILQRAPTPDACAHQNWRAHSHSSPHVLKVAKQTRKTALIYKYCLLNCSIAFDGCSGCAPTSTRATWCDYNYVCSWTIGCAASNSRECHGYVRRWYSSENRVRALQTISVCSYILLNVCVCVCVLQ